MPRMHHPSCFFSEGAASLLLPLFSLPGKRLTSKALLGLGATNGTSELLDKLDTSLPPHLVSVMRKKGGELTPAEIKHAELQVRSASGVTGGWGSRAKVLCEREWMRLRVDALAGGSKKEEAHCVAR